MKQTIEIEVPDGYKVEYNKDTQKVEIVKIGLPKTWEEILMGYIRKFEKKHDVKLQYAVDDDIMGVLNFCDAYFFDATDVVYDIDHNLPKEMILDWYNDTIDYYKNPTKEKVSLEMYHKRSQIKKMAENFSYNRVMAEAIAYKKRNM